MPRKSEANPSTSRTYLINLLLIFVVAWNLRTVLALVGAAASEIEAELGAGGAATGAVSTVFVLTSAVGAPLAMALSRRINSRWLTFGAMLLIGLAQAVLLGASNVTIWVAVCLAGFGGGMIGAVLPSLVNALLPGKSGGGVAAFMLASSLGFYAASVAVPLALNAGYKWQHVAVLLLVISAAAAWAWVSSKQVQAAGLNAPPPAVSRGVAKRTAWPRWLLWLVIFLSAQSVVVFAQIAWLAPSLRQVGASQTAAANMLGLLSGLQIVSGMLFPLLAQRWASKKVDLSGALLVASGLLVLLGSGLGTILLIQASGGAAFYAVVVLLALGHGGSFALANYVIANLSDSPRQAIRNGALVMCISQLFGASGPTIFGYLRDINGSYALPWITLVVCALIQVGFAVTMLPALRRSAISAKDGGSL